MSGVGREPSYNPGITSPTEVRADFPATAASAGQARRFLDATLRAWSCDGLVEVATLLLSELVANSVLHAGSGIIAVVVRTNGARLRVEVHDGNARLPSRKHYSAVATTGRGLLLVEQMSADWGATASADGKSVWFELDRTPTGPDAEAAVRSGGIAVDGLENRADLDPLTEAEYRTSGGGSGRLDFTGLLRAPVGASA